MIERGQVGICAVCARQEAGLGVKVNPKSRRSAILWLCDDPECLRLAKVTKDMRQDEFNRVEKRAATLGGNEAGKFLEQIARTDLAKLSKAEWEEFCRRLVTGYRKALKGELRG